MTCLPRSSTARLSAPPTVCSTRPPARCARSARSAGDWTCAAAPARACGSSGSLCQEPAAGVDFSAGMLAQARGAHSDAGWVRADARALPFAGVFDLAVSFGALGHFLPAERPPLFAGVYRALRPGGVFAFPAAAPPRVTSGWYWALLGFDLAMRVRNALWRPPFVMYYRTCPLPALRSDLTASGFTVTTVPLTALGMGRDGNPRNSLVLARKAGTPSLPRTPTCVSHRLRRSRKVTSAIAAR